MRGVTSKSGAFKLLTLLLAFAVFLSCNPVAESSEAPSGTELGPDEIPARGVSGMVSSAHPLATEVGLEILGRGGNAFDAAVAVAAALNVVEPMMSGMGGYGTILVYSAEEGRARFLNPSGRIPRGVDSDAYRAPTPNYRENRRGPKAISTPGNVNAWAAMSGEYGALPWPSSWSRLPGWRRRVSRSMPGPAGSIEAAWEAFPDHVTAFLWQERSAT